MKRNILQSPVPVPEIIGVNFGYLSSGIYPGRSNEICSRLVFGFVFVFNSAN